MGQKTILNRNENTKGMSTQMLIQECSQQRYSSQPKYENNPNVHQGMNGQSSYKETLFFSAIKRSKIWIHCKIWMNLETLC